MSSACESDGSRRKGDWMLSAEAMVSTGSSMLKAQPRMSILPMCTSTGRQLSTAPMDVSCSVVLSAPTCKEGSRKMREVRMNPKSCTLNGKY